MLKDRDFVEGLRNLLTNCTEERCKGAMLAAQAIAELAKAGQFAVLFSFVVSNCVFLFLKCSCLPQHGQN